jgi:hypothetical protein
MFAAAAVGVLGIGAGIDWASAHPVSRVRKAARLATFDVPNAGVKFRYPAAWHRLREVAVSPISALIVYLSNQRLHATCKTTTDENLCGSPIKRLAPRSILVSVTINGSPLWSFAHAPGKLLKINGRQAKLAITHTRCAVSGNLEMDLVMPSIPDNWYDFNACIRGPATNLLKDQFDELVRTVHLVD